MTKSQAEQYQVQPESASSGHLCTRLHNPHGRQPTARYPEIGPAGSHHQFKHPTKPGKVTVPHPTPLEQLASNPEYQGGVWVLADIDLTRIDTKPVRLNISLPANLVQQIDTHASAHHMTRSGFLARAAQQAMHG